MNWELLFKVVGSTAFLGLLALLLKHFVVAAPVRFAATRQSDTTLITDLQTRVGKLEGIVAQLQRSLSRRQSEKNALFFANDAISAELRLSALMHENNERPAAVLIERWKKTPDSHTVLEALPVEEGAA